MSVTENTPHKPFLRILKLAYKLHKDGVNHNWVQAFISAAAAIPADKLPTAARPSVDILATVFNELPADLQNIYGSIWSNMAADLGMAIAVDA